MLTQLSIRNYAIVDHLEVDFRPGMSAITGETGAGKSIILGALGLTLGDRADKGVISTGASRADISARFETMDQPHARLWLQENELLLTDEPELCLLRRVVGDDGRSRAWVNGYPVTLQILKNVGEMLIDIHSQHEHQSLLNKGTHLRLLDEFIGAPNLLTEVRQIARDWRRNHERLTMLSQQSEESSAHNQLLLYQLNELDESAPGEGELAALEEEHRTLDSADSTLAIAQQLLELCSEGEEQTLVSGLQHALSLLQDSGVRSPSLQSVADLVNTATIQIEEAVVELRHCIDHFEADPQRLEEVNQRLAEIHQLARKHKCKPEDLAALHADLRQQVQQTSGSEEEIRRLEELDTTLQKQYQTAARQLSEKRLKAAAQLGEQINGQIAQLGMGHARLTVELSASSQTQPNPTGLESVEFLVTTNPGQAPRPLIRIASGGELSRISLAIQVITASTSATPTLVFDEVDVGIGGSVAHAVGRLLRQLGEKGQVLCVTHQAQVASHGHHHLLVSKQVEGRKGAARMGTRLKELSAEEKVLEIARMLGGEAGNDGFTPESLAHAEEMLGARTA